MRNYESVVHLIESPDQEVDPVHPIKHFIKSGEIEFEGYSSQFGAPLHDISFKIKAGEKVLIAGRSGAGKTSIANAIARVMEGTKGRVCIDEVDLKKVSILEI